MERVFMKMASNRAVGVGAIVARFAAERARRRTSN